MTIGEWVNQYRKSHGMSMQAFGDVCGLSRAYISILEKGINPTTGKPFIPTIQTIRKIADCTGTDFDSLFSMIDGSQKVTVNDSPQKIIGPQPACGVRIPVLGRVVAGIPIEAITDIIDYEEIPAQMAKSGTYFALQVKGRSMEPTLHEGDVVIVRQQPEVENGEIAIVLVNGNDATVKEVKEGPDGLTLIGHNVGVYSPHFYTREQIQDLPIRIIGKVVELRRKF